MPIPQKKKPNILFIVIALILVVAIFGGGYLLGNSGNNTDTDNRDSMEDSEEMMNDETTMMDEDENDDDMMMDDDEMQEENMLGGTPPDPSEKTISFNGYEITFDTIQILEEVTTKQSFISQAPYVTCELYPEEIDAIETENPSCEFATYTFGVHSRYDFMLANTNEFYFGGGGTVPTVTEDVTAGGIDFSVTYYESDLESKELIAASACYAPDLCIYFAPEVQYIELGSEAESVLSEIDVKSFINFMDDLVEIR